MKFFQEKKVFYPVRVWEIGTNIAVVHDIGDEYLVYFDDKTWRPTDADLWSNFTTPYLRRFGFGAIRGNEQSPRWKRRESAVADAHRFLAPLTQNASWSSEPRLLRDVSSETPAIPCNGLL